VTDRTDQLENEVITFVRNEFEATGEIERNTQLIADGIVDSIGVLRLVRFLEDRFGVQIDPQDLVLENFASVKAIVNLLRKRMN